MECKIQFDAMLWGNLGFRSMAYQDKGKTMNQLRSIIRRYTIGKNYIKGNIRITHPLTNKCIYKHPSEITLGVTYAKIFD